MVENSPTADSPETLEFLSREFGERNKWWQAYAAESDLNDPTQIAAEIKAHERICANLVKTIAAGKKRNDDSKWLAFLQKILDGVNSLANVLKMGRVLLFERFSTDNKTEIFKVSSSLLSAIILVSTATKVSSLVEDLPDKNMKERCDSLAQKLEEILPAITDTILNLDAHVELDQKCANWIRFMDSAHKRLSKQKDTSLKLLQAYKDKDLFEWKGQLVILEDYSIEHLRLLNSFLESKEFGSGDSEFHVASEMRTIAEGVISYIAALRADSVIEEDPKRVSYLIEIVEATGHQLNFLRQEFSISIRTSSPLFWLHSIT